MFFVICEDESAFAEELRLELERLLLAKQISCHIMHCQNGAELERLLLGEEPVDLLFMDIHLGEEDGVELVKKLHPNLPATVFLTSLESRIAEGYDVNAVNFLFKRNYKDKLPGVLERFWENYQCKAITLLQHEETVLLRMEEIYYVEPDGRCTAVVTANARYQDKNSIQNFVRQLPGELFVEAYKSLFINIEHIRKVGANSVVMDNDQELPVSRRKRKELMAAVMKRLRSR